MFSPIKNLGSKQIPRIRPLYTDRIKTNYNKTIKGGFKTPKFKRFSPGEKKKF